MITVEKIEELIADIEPVDDEQIQIRQALELARWALSEGIPVMQKFPFKEADPACKPMLAALEKLRSEAAYTRAESTYNFSTRVDLCHKSTELADWLEKQREGAV